MRRSLLLTLAVMSCAPAGRSPERPPAPSPGGAVYDGDVTIEPATGAVQARWRISFMRAGALADTVRLRLNGGVRVASVTGPAVAANATAIDDDEQIITVALAPGSRGSATHPSRPHRR